MKIMILGSLDKVCGMIFYQGKALKGDCHAELAEAPFYLIINALYILSI